MINSKNRKLSVKVLILMAFTALVCILALVYFAVFKNLTVVQDSSWKTVLPKGYYLQLQGKLVKKGYRLRVKTIESDILDEANLSYVFSKLDTGGLIVANPVVTAAVTSLKLDLEDKLKNATVIGIGYSNSSGLFDEVLVSNVVSGWEKAAKEAVEISSKVAVLYNSDSLAEAQVLCQNLTASQVTQINKDEYGKLFASDIKKKLTEDKTEVVFCPYVSNLSDFVSATTEQKWVVDYRYSTVIPSAKLLGVVYPDLFTSLESFFNPSLLNFEEGTNYLLYEFRKIK